MEKEKAKKDEIDVDGDIFEMSSSSKPKKPKSSEVLLTDSSDEDFETNGMIHESQIKKKKYFKCK